MKKGKIVILIINFLFLVIPKIWGQSSNSTLYQNDTLIIGRHPEVYPEFPGGQKALSCFLDQNLSEEIKSIKGKGFIVAQFSIDTTGKVKDLVIVKSFNESADNEFKRVLSLMPNWKPGKIEGKPIKIKFTIPLRIPYENKICH